MNSCQLCGKTRQLIIYKVEGHEFRACISCIHTLRSMKEWGTEFEVDVGEDSISFSVVFDDIDFLD